MNDTTPTESTSEKSGKLERVPVWLNTPRALGLIALVLVIAAWVITHRQIVSLEKQLATRLSAFDTRSSESRVLAGQAQEAGRELQVKVGVLEQKLAESQNQQLALEALYQELARGRDEVVVAEIEQLLLGASQQLQLSGNVKGALIALQTAETRLQRLDRPQLFALRKAIGKDIERLRLAPLVDIPGLALKLDGLIELADTLPLLPGAPAPEKSKDKAKPVESRWWQHFSNEVWSDFINLVRVQNMQKAELPLLAPEQAYYARENLKLRLLSARLALLAHDEKSYKADLQLAQTWIKRYYDTQDKTVKTAVALVQQLASGSVNVNVPDIAGSLAAVHTFKPVAEKAAR